MKGMALTSTASGFRRPRIGSATLSVCVALYTLLLLNRTFWSKAFEYLAGQEIALLGLAIGLTAAFVALFLSISVKYITKPLLILFIVIGATTSWFMDRFGIVIDVEMIRNVAETSGPEANRLLTFGFVLHMLLYAALPSVLIAWVRIDHRPFWKKLVYNLAVIVPCLVVLGGAGLSQAGTYAFTTREHRDWFESLNPIFPIGSFLRYLIRTTEERDLTLQPLGRDAHVADSASAGQRKPRVTIVVVGETARAENFQLGGYERPTNPELKKRDIVYFGETSSCGTATAVSVPCMFSVYGRSDYTHRKGLATENLMDVLSHAGIHAEWWDNNTGSKGMAARIPYRELFRSRDIRFCTDGECRDDILLDQLDGWLDKVTGDSVLVLHQLGSHGPAYFARYPEAFRRFEPDCRSVEFTACSRDEIVNAYDNSILYTDHILSVVIDKLAAREDRISPTMIYMSDHGESLGEKGLFLHGAPYLVAPAQQTHVPFILWLGREAKAQTDATCLVEAASRPQSHDNLFPTVLGLMHVETKIRNNTLDLFTACRKGET